MNNGFFYSCWSDGSSFSYNNLAGGEYSVKWSSGSGNLVVGKDGTQAEPSSLHFSIYNQNILTVFSSGWLHIRGLGKPREWIPLSIRLDSEPARRILYHRKFRQLRPLICSIKEGDPHVDGSVYNILTTTRTNQPSINGTATFQQFWSVRQNKRVGGTLTLEHISQPGQS